MRDGFSERLPACPVCDETFAGVMLGNGAYEPWNVPLVAPVEVGEKRKNISTCSHCTSLGLFTPTRIHDKRTCPLNPAAGVQATPRARPVPYANAGAPVRADNAPGFRGKRIRVGC